MGTLPVAEAGSRCSPLEEVKVAQRCAGIIQTQRIISSTAKTKKKSESSVSVVIASEILQPAYSGPRTDRTLFRCVSVLLRLTKSPDFGAVIYSHYLVDILAALTQLCASPSGMSFFWIPQNILQCVAVRSFQRNPIHIREHVWLTALQD